MGAPLRHAVDIESGEPEPPRARSVANLALPLQLVGILIAQAVMIVLWLDHRFTSLEADIQEQGKELRAEMYRPMDAEKDREMCNLRIDGMARRIDVLEHYIDGRGHRW